MTYRRRDPTWLVFGCSRSFSPCVFERVLVRQRPLVFAKGCRRSCQRSCQDHVSIDHLTRKRVICVKWQAVSHLISKDRFSLASITIPCLMVFSQSTAQVHDNAALHENHHT